MSTHNIIMFWIRNKGSINLSGYLSNHELQILSSIVFIMTTCLYNADPHLLYSKTGVYRGIHYFSSFCSKT